MRSATRFLVPLVILATLAGCATQRHEQRRAELEQDQREVVQIVEAAETTAQGVERALEALPGDPALSARLADLDELIAAGRERLDELSDEIASVDDEIEAAQASDGAAWGIAEIVLAIAGAAIGGPALAAGPVLGRIRRARLEGEEFGAAVVRDSVAIGRAASPEFDRFFQDERLAEIMRSQLPEHLETLIRNGSTISKRRMTGAGVDA